MHFFKRQIAVVILTVIYVMAGLFAKLRFFSNRKHVGPLLLIGTFHNPNWIFAHVEPIVRSMETDVFLVTDDPVKGLAGVTNFCAPKLLQKVLTRAGAKFVWSLYASIKLRPSLCMGYHVFPAGVIALVAAAVCGAHASFQVTSGQLELEGGGWHAENALLAALGKKSWLVEKAVHFLVRQFDLVIVRGLQAKRYIQNIGFQGILEVITGSVVYPEVVADYTKRDIDLLFVGRLTESKRIDRLVRIFNRVVILRPETRLVLIGDGPEMNRLKSDIAKYDLQDRVDILGQRKDVAVFQARSRINVLTSRWEGVSIAMLEAMAYGVVPVVFDVGDLKDFVTPETGALLAEDDNKGFAGTIVSILNNEEYWLNHSLNCRKMIYTTSSKQAVCARWKQILSRINVVAS